MAVLAIENASKLVGTNLVTDFTRQGECLKHN